MQRAESNSSCCTESTSSSSTTNRGELEGRLVAAGSFRCGEAVHCQDGKLAGDLLRLWPDGKIGRPEEYGEVAWERVMGVNEKWSYPAESNGHVTAIMSILSNLSHVVNAVSSLLALGKEAQLSRRDLKAVYKACANLGDVVAFHVELTEYYMSVVVASGARWPKKLLVLFNLLKQAHEECMPSFQSLVKGHVTTGAIQGLLNDIIAFRHAFLRCAREELEHLVFLVRTHFSEDEALKLEENVLAMQGKERGLIWRQVAIKHLAMVGVLFGGIPGPDHVRRSMIISRHSPAAAWLGMHLVFRPLYHFTFLAPLNRVINKASQHEGMQASVDLHIASESRTRRMSSVSLPHRDISFVPADDSQAGED
mmetsp:Transcript_24264/g.63042  ORF Transcript_24264/g.63042 Transcript_24264/m.63042 type:complete len:366 (-) Transcript_24264:295-1392(-)